MICPICKKTFADSDENRKYRPFCSRRCQLIDLGNWLGERYAVPGEAAPDGEATSNTSEAREKPPQP
jgi:endogenous inhibitor of DNA gyrase (YacG/DUF329 family)